LVWLGRFDEALVKIKRLGEVEPDSQLQCGALALYFLARSELGRCLEEIHRSEERELNPRIKQCWRAWYLALSGEKEQARMLLQREEALPVFFPTTFLIVRTYVELGDLDACFRWLNSAVSNHNIALQQCRLDPRFMPLRDDPRFHQLLKKMNLA